jgi:hypothetical protein
MRIEQSFTMSLSGVTSGNIGFDEKIAIADAIFRSLKYIAVDDGLDRTVFIESISVDGEEDLFTQYQTLRNETVVFGTYEWRRRNLKDGGVNDSAAVERSQQRRRLGTYTFDATAKIVMSERLPVDWKTIIDLYFARLRANIASGFFDTELQDIDTNGYGYSDYDGHWRSSRRLGTLAVAAVDPAYGDTGVELGSYDAVAVYGNSPTGMPTTAPSSSAPTTLKSRLEDLGLYDVSTVPSYFPLLPYAWMWFIASLLMLSHGFVSMRKAAIDSDLLEKKIEALEEKRERALLLRQNQAGLKSSAVAPAPTRSNHDQQHKEQALWEVGEVELEMHINRVLGLDKGIYSPSHTGPVVTKYWYEMGVYHSFLRFLYPNHGTMLCGAPNVYALNWNRFVRGCALLCHYTLAFCILGLFMLAQYPNDDKQCLRITSETQCHGWNKQFLGMYTYCKWTDGDHGDNKRYCAFRDVEAYDDRVLVLCTILVAVLCAPISMLFEQLWNLLLRDMEVPSVNSLYTVQAMLMEEDPYDDEDNDEVKGRSAKQKALDKYLRHCTNQAEFDGMDALSQRTLLSHFFESVEGVGVIGTTRARILNYAGKFNLQKTTEHRTEYLDKLTGLIEGIELYRTTIPPGPKRESFDLLAGVKTCGGHYTSYVPGKVEFYHHIKGMNGVLTNLESVVPTTKDAGQTPMKGSIRGRFGKAASKKAAAFKSMNSMLDASEEASEDLSAPFYSVHGKNWLHLWEHNFANNRNVCVARTMNEAFSVMNNKSAIEARSLFAMKRAMHTRQAIASSCIELEGDHLAMGQDDWRGANQEDDKHVEALARSQLGIATMRLFFRDLLGRARNSAAESCYNNRYQEMSPGRFREDHPIMPRICTILLAALSLICCIVSFFTLTYRLRDVYPSIFYTWFTACGIYVAHDWFLVQTTNALFISFSLSTYFSDVMEATRREVMKAALHVWREMGKKAAMRYDGNPECVRSVPGMRLLLDHIFPSFRLARAHPFLFESGVVESLDKNWDENIRTFVEESAEAKAEGVPAKHSKKLASSTVAPASQVGGSANSLELGTLSPMALEETPTPTYIDPLETPLPGRLKKSKKKPWEGTVATTTTTTKSHVGPYHKTLKLSMWNNLYLKAAMHFHTWNEKYGIGREGVLRFLSSSPAVMRMVCTMCFPVIPFFVGYIAYSTSTVTVGSVHVGTIVTYALYALPLILFVLYSLCSFCAWYPVRKDKSRVKVSTLHAFHRKVKKILDVIPSDQPEEEEEEEPFRKALANEMGAAKAVEERDPLTGSVRIRSTKKQVSIEEEKKEAPSKSSSRRAQEQLIKDKRLVSAMSEDFIDHAVHDIVAKVSGRFDHPDESDDSDEPERTKKQAHRDAEALFTDYIHTAEEHIAASRSRSGSKSGRISPASRGSSFKTKSSSRRSQKEEADEMGIGELGEIFGLMKADLDEIGRGGGGMESSELDDRDRDHERRSRRASTKSRRESTQSRRTSTRSPDPIAKEKSRVKKNRFDIKSEHSSDLDTEIAKLSAKIQRKKSMQGMTAAQKRDEEESKLHAERIRLHGDAKKHQIDREYEMERKKKDARSALRKRLAKGGKLTETSKARGDTVEKYLPTVDNRVDEEEEEDDSERAAENGVEEEEEEYRKAIADLQSKAFFQTRIGENELKVTEEHARTRNKQRIDAKKRHKRVLKRYKNVAARVRFLHRLGGAGAAGGKATVRNDNETDESEAEEGEKQQQQDGDEPDTAARSEELNTW